jgi:FKBP-type peptidyl-prolyl cis-trans isomerase
MKKLILIMLFLITYGVVFSQKKDTITTKSGLKYVQLKAGNGKNPVDGQKVKVTYTAKFTNGKVFESNADDVPFKFTLGAKEVIPGWDEGFKLMSVGEKGVMIIPARLAYGKRGSKDESGKYIVPPDTDLIFEVILVGFK